MHARRSVSTLGEWNEIVLASPLENQKDRRSSPAIDDEVWAFGGDAKRLPTCQPHIFLRLLEKDSNFSFYHIECVADVVVVVPRHLLRGTYVSACLSTGCHRGTRGEVHQVDCRVAIPIVDDAAFNA
jgi:hypothetical protein